MGIPYVVKNYNILIDISTNVVLTIEKRASIISFLSDSTPGTRPFYTVNSPNYNSFTGLSFLGNIEPHDYVDWTWESKTRKFSKTNPEVLNGDLRSASRLMKSKCKAINSFVSNLNIARFKYMTGIVLQETVYANKSLQAKEFKESGYNENLLVEYPYVEQYATFAKMSPRQAADEILFKKNLYDQHLAKTELLRLKYFTLVKNAQKPEEVDQILEDFKSDCHYK